MSPKNMAASVRARLAEIARRANRPFQELLQYYAMERFLYRLSKSPHAGRFVLKGALMLRVWDAPMARPTKDIDLLGRLENSLENLSMLVREVCGWVGKETPVHFHGHNDFGMATACAVAAVRGGASWIQGTINGMGERAGNADIGEIALALRCLYDVPVALDLTKVREVSEVVQKAAGYTVDAWKPIVGENLFMRESGAVATQFHIPEAIEPYSSDLVSAQRKIVLGKKSGLDSIDLKCKELGIAIRPEQRATILAAVKKRSIAKHGLVSDEDFREIVAQLAGAGVLSST